MWKALRSHERQPQNETALAINFTRRCGKWNFCLTAGNLALANQEQR